MGRAEALRVLKSLLVVDKYEVTPGGVQVEERLIGTFAPEVSKRDIPALRKTIELQGALQDTLTDDVNAPSTTFDPQKGRITITTRSTIA